jgi:hypothetical protein
MLPSNDMKGKFPMRLLYTAPKWQSANRPKKIHWGLIHCSRHQSGKGAAVVVRCRVLGRHQFQVVARSQLVGQDGLLLAVKRTR